MTGSAGAATAPVAEASPRPTAEPARLRHRIGSILYEGLLVIALVFIAALLFVGLARVLGGDGDRLPAIARGALFVYVLAVLGGYFVWFWSRGQTLAMRAWRLRVVDAHGRFPSAWRALARYLAALALLGPGLLGGLWLRQRPDSSITWALVAVALFSLAWARFDRERRALYDIVAGTRLVRLLEKAR